MEFLEKDRKVHFLFLLVLSFIGGLPSLYFQYLKGADPYFFFNSGMISFPPVFHLISLMPMWAIRFLPMIFIFLTSVLVFFIAEELNHDGHLSSLAIFFGASLLFRLNVIEDDLLGLVLGLLSIYWYLRWGKEGNFRHLAGVGLSLLACVFVWDGFVFFVVLFLAYLLFENGLDIFGYGSVLYATFVATPKSFFTGAIRVGEHNWGLPYFICFNFLLMFGFFVEWKNSFLRVWLLFSILMAVMSGQYVFLAVPPLAIISSKAFHKMGGWWGERDVKFLVGVGLFLGLLLSFAQLSRTTPFEEDMEFIDKVETMVPDDECTKGGWGYGYWMKWKGVNATSYGSPGRTGDEDCSWLLSRECSPVVLNGSRYDLCHE